MQLAMACCSSCQQDTSKGTQGLEPPRGVVLLVQVLWTFVHRASEVLGPGIDLPISELYHAHFRLLPLPNRTCTPSTREGEGEQWVRDTTVADIAARARECAQAGFFDNKVIDCLSKRPLTAACAHPCPRHRNSASITCCSNTISKINKPM